MASSAALSPTMLALAAADKPMLIGQNWLRQASAFRWNATGTFADPDVTDSTYPTYRVADGFDWLPSAPNTTANTWYLLFNLGALRLFDVIAVLGHSGLTGVTVTAEVADNSSFTTNLVQIYSWGTLGSGITRLVGIDLRHTGSYARMYEAQYVRLKFAKGSAFTPFIREVVIGNRRQLKENPSRPWDPDAGTSLTSRFEVGSQATDYVLARKFRTVDALLEPYEEPYISDLVAFWGTDLNGGVEPFLWIPKPNSEPTKAYWMKLDNPALSFPKGDMVTQRSWRMQATEKGAQLVSRESA